MKGKTIKNIVLSALLLLILIPVVSQVGNGSDYSAVEASKYCGENLSAYREFFRINLYQFAHEPWLRAFNDCPGSSEKMYVDGATMYHSYIEAAPEGPVREGLIDTLMLIYDRRMEYFGGEGNVLGRKGRDLLTYRGTDMEQVQEAYALLKKSFELMGIKSQEAVMVLFLSAGVSLNKAGILAENQVIEDYINTMGILAQLDKSSSRWERTRTAIDEIMLKEDFPTCEAVTRYYESRFEQNKNDKTFLEEVINFFASSGCDRPDLYLEASENLYHIAPGPESAHNLAFLFINRNDFEKATSYLEEAVQSESTNAETRAEWYYELAVVSNATKDYCKAIEYAREAIKLKSDYGKAYLLLGDVFVASRFNLGDDFQQRTAFWAAADKYRKASSADPSLAKEASERLADYAGQYPNKEDVFFHDIKNGDSYLVGGCINENTTVRSSN